MASLKRALDTKRCAVWLTAVAVALIGVGCTGSGCLEGRTGSPQVEFRSSSTGESIGLDSLAISGFDAPGDSLLMRPSASAQSSVSLPLRPDRSTTVWSISYERSELAAFGLRDTVTFDYRATPYFVSEECGVGYRFHLSRVTTTHRLIDSVVILDPLVTNITKPYVALYFRTASE